MPNNANPPQAGRGSAPAQPALALAVVAMMCAAPLFAGVVYTPTERLEGRVGIADGGVTVAGRRVATADVVLADVDATRRTFSPAHAVRLAGGEVWRCRIRSLSAGKLTIASALFGERAIGTAGITALDFRANLPAPSHLRPHTLYREEGEPLPGALLWISPDDIAVDSPLGALAIARPDVTRYTMDLEAVPGPSAGVHELHLIDGSILRGTAELGARQVTLTHARLGKLTLPTELVRSIVRHEARLTWLAEQPFTAEAVPLIAAPPAEPVTAGPAGPPDERPAGAVRALRIAAGGRVRYRLAGAAAAGAEFRASLWPPPLARGAVVVEVAAGGKTVLQKRIDPSQPAPVPVAVRLPKAGELTIRVSFAEQLRFPAGVVLGDPHLISGP